MWQMKEGYKPFQEFGRDVYTMASFFPAEVSYNIADPVTAKEIFSSSPRFPKPLKFYTLLNYFGDNVVGSDGAIWKKHRKPSAPAFRYKNNKLVWDEAAKITLSLFDTPEWCGKDVVRIDHALDVTLPLALAIISISGFGREMRWENDAYIPTGHTMTFKDALHIVSGNLRVKLLVPEWALPFRANWRLVERSFKELQKYMLEMVTARRTSEVKEERYDLFSGLLDATEKDDARERLTDAELLGNIFVFLLAGHETTAHTLAFAFGLLALHPEEQDKLYEEIIGITPDLRIPTYDELGKFKRTMAVLYETLRFFPPANGIGKTSAEDTTLPTSTGESIVVPQGTLLALDFLGLHHNTKYWTEPEKFDPSRFLKPDWPREAFFPFSGGVRSCLGRRFFESEAVAILAVLLSRYRVALPDDLDVKPTWENILVPTMSLTMAPKRIPLAFHKR
ncbi:614/534 cytochrome P450 [Auricularia subglabra TFB-10046 SS5]|uniref:614/534 cytochrome P450 n=1 Tax=Auricularia subglabra (strain TFB-10046 / SS5) TaxID=717982 RepID=J0D8K4_AURST|nr:614/534 cytochrome P450 [Auricularia subglabra TFB-10046 SS5]